MKYMIVSLECWRDDGLWSVNDEYKVGEIDFDKEPTTRKLLSVLREIDLLSEASKGKVVVEDISYPYFTILARSDREPLYELRPLI